MKQLSPHKHLAHALGIATICVFVTATIVMANWYTIDTNNGVIDSVWNGVPPAYTSNSNDSNIDDRDEIKQAWYAFDGDALYIKFQSWDDNDILWYNGRRAVAALDCNDNGVFIDEEDRRIVFEDSGNVQLVTGNYAHLLVENQNWGEQVNGEAEWQMPLVELPSNCRGSVTPVTMALFIDRTTDNVILSQATGSHTLDNPIDYGDAHNFYDPGNQTCDDYDTLLSCNGARHGITPLHLGANIDADSGDLQNDAATADDNDNVNDEDGVAPHPGFTWFTGNGGGLLDVMVTNGYGFLSCWIDWNNDGDFQDSSEQIMDDAVVGEGQQSLNISVPAGIDFSAAYMARCRLSAAENKSDTPTGAVMSGEVEDYDWLIQPVQPSITLESGDVKLSWTHLEQNAEEQAYKNTTPYFNFSDGTSLGWSGSTGTATDWNVGGAPADIIFYKVVGSVPVGADSIYSTPSKEMGLFEFALTPGVN